MRTLNIRSATWPTRKNDNPMDWMHWIEQRLMESRLGEENATENEN